MTANKPTVLIIPGGWHPASLYDPLSAAFASAGYSVITLTLPSLDPVPSPPSFPIASFTCAHDVAHARSVLAALVEEQGLEIVLYAHSYGGIVGAGAARGLSLTTRQKEGKEGGVKGIVHACGFVIPEGVSIKDFFGGRQAPWVGVDQPSLGLCQPLEPVSVLFNDLDPDEAEQYASRLRPHALAAFDSPAPPPAWAEGDFRGRLGFIRTVRDAALPCEVQDMFLNKPVRDDGAKVEWAVRQMDAGHESLLLSIVEVVRLVEEMEGGFGTI